MRTEDTKDQIYVRDVQYSEIFNLFFCLDLVLKSVAVVFHSFWSNSLNWPLHWRPKNSGSPWMVFILDRLLIGRSSALAKWMGLKWAHTLECFWRSHRLIICKWIQVTVMALKSILNLIVMYFSAWKMKKTWNCF